MALLARLRSPQLTFAQTVLSLLLGAVALLSSYWCEGCQKVPKPLCSLVKRSNCIPVPGLANSSSVQFSWETGDDRFVFPTFHSGLWMSCTENIYKDVWEEKCRSFMALTPGSEKGILWLAVSMEIVYISLLFLSCLLLFLQLCLAAWFPSAERWGLLGMVAHMMFMQVFHVTASMGPEDFKPHSYGYSWAFYMAWVAFVCCMSSGICTLNNYTKKVLMRGPKHKRLVYPCRNFTFPPQPPPAPFYCPPPSPPSVLPPSPPPPPLSHLSPYYASSTPEILSEASPPQTQLCLPPPPPPAKSAPHSPYYAHSAPSPTISLAISTHSYMTQNSEEEYSPL
ncbi:germ cell-specific gene 1-like protein isoform X2 [Denticeps clupeoides]|uniref:germ cell-specific gene 1-like protein isoform X2 n=1 Tax=Denticeps clupeoides TaxID=299321 RepID=UPI0010A303C5|nr:germ cell-specific gene 1-like protein isoform X2 [Denticeps clupeoides]